jgi:hypothetical protein
LVLTHGGNSLGYRGLDVHDATGRALPAHVQLHDGRVLVRVGDQAAQYPVTVDPFISAAKLVASDGAGGDQLGMSVAMSGSTVVFGVQQAAVGGNSQQGAAYVFAQPGGGWPGAVSPPLVQVAKLTASDGAGTAHFGSSVAIDETASTVVVGARSAKIPPGSSNNNTGAVYVFPAPWTGTTASPQHEAAKLTASDPVAQSLLGASVAISGTNIVAGADGSGAVGGAVYVFPAPWTGTSASPQHEAAKLTASDAASGAALGASVAISGNALVAGASAATVNGNLSQGAAYVFVAPWTGTSASPQHETSKLTASDGAAGNQFGFTNQTGISGNTVAVGSTQATVNGTAQGAVYVFPAPWTGTVASPQHETAKLTASDGIANDGLGSSVGISGSVVVAGAFGATINGNTGQGAAYVFTAPWTGTVASPQNQTAKLTASDGARGDSLGFSVAISGTTVVAGADVATVTNTRQGAGYVFVANPAGTATTLNNITPSAPVAAGTGETLTATITPGAAGTVQFMDGSTPLGAPVVETIGTATLAATLTSGNHSLTAVFTPADPTSFTGSTSSPIAYAVNSKRPLCIRLCN